jgi:heat shock protein HslJ
MMACEPQEVTQQEADFLTALSKTTGFEITEDGLLRILYDGGVLTFSKVS